jgi:uncharacterized lipoprotein NlpE involved in copper resistance
MEDCIMKNRHLLLILVTLLLIGFTSCATMGAKDKIDWQGKYSGRIPAADGPGIEVQITLNADSTFTIVYDYIDSEGYDTGTGTFSWDKKGNIIHLTDTVFPPYYEVGKEYLLQLDLKGKKIKGDLANFYYLRKAH